MSTITAPTPTATSTHVERLRALVAEDPVAAQTDAWAWFAEAGQRARRDRGAALAELAELFETGAPSRGIDGATTGMLVTFTVTNGVDRALAALTQAWMPWAGKRFDAAHDRGDNLLAPSARIPARLPWPRYAMTPSPEGLVAFDFETWVEPGKTDPDTDVLVIDYASVAANPAVVIKSIRDELVEIVPGAHLGKMLWRHRDGRHSLLAYFALRSRL